MKDAPKYFAVGVVGIVCLGSFGCVAVAMALGHEPNPSLVVICGSALGYLGGLFTPTPGGGNPKP